jgi:hypothetical protein
MGPKFDVFTAMGLDLTRMGCQLLIITAMGLRTINGPRLRGTIPIRRHLMLTLKVLHTYARDVVCLCLELYIPTLRVP